MKKLLYFSMVLVFGMMSCAEDDPVTYPSIALTDTVEDFEMLLQDSRNQSIVLPKFNDGQTLDLGAVVVFAGAAKLSAINYTYTVTEPATLPAGLTSSGSGSIPAGELSGLLPITVDLDAFELGVPNTISIQLATSDAPQTDLTTITYTYTVICPSELAGSYSAVSTVTNQSAGIGWDDCEGSSWSGTVEIEEVTPGVYNVYTDGLNGGQRLLDPSFGAYYACYETPSQDNLPNGNLILQDVCGKLSIEGASQWGEVYTFNRVEPKDKELTLGWTNDYGEGGTVVLTRTEGSWNPELRF